MQTKLLEVTQIGPILAGIFDIPAKFWPEPGQYLPCQFRPEDQDFLPTNLFRVIGGPKELLSLGPLPQGWRPGDRIGCLPPQGKGFNLPGSARRVGLLTLSHSPLYLLTLVHPALAQDAAISLFCDPIPHVDILNRLPIVVEIAPSTSLQENLDWPDFLAVHTTPHELARVSNFLGMDRLPFVGQVLLETPMPCHGVSACGICSVKTRHGWRLSCVDGPVFPLEEVLHVAG